MHRRYLLLLFSVLSIFSTSAQYSAKNIEEHRSFLKKVSVDDGEMAYLDIGQGEVIMLVHGIPTSSWLYRHMVPQLVRAGYRVIAPDLLGYGSSDKSKDINLYDPKKQAARLVQLMDQLEIDSWHHVCHDAGGIWTWEMLEENTDRLKSLTMLNTIVFKEGFDPPLTFKKGSYWGKKYSNMYCSKTFGKGMMNATLKHGLMDNDLSKSEKEGYWLPMREGAHKAINNFFTGFAYTYEQLPIYQERLKKSSFPVCLIWGQNDKILIGEKQIPMIKTLLGIPDFRIHMLDEAKHYIQEEKPEKISLLIHQFISEM